MMKNIVSISLLFLCSCKMMQKPKNNDGVYEYLYCVETEGADGYILFNRCLGIADTTLALVRGKILGEDGYLKNAAVTFYNDSLNKNFGVITDNKGEYYIYLPIGQYNITFSGVGYMNMTLKDLDLKSGQLQEVSVKLGSGSTFTEYSIKSKKPLTKMQVKRRAQKGQN